MPEFAAQALIQKLGIALDPAPDGDVIHRQSTLRHHILQIPVAQRITQVPPDAQDDDDILEVSPAEQHWPVLAHRFTLPEPLIRFATDPIDAVALVGAFQVSAAALVQFRSVDGPAPDATGVNAQTAFERHLGHVRKGDRKPQVPPHAPENDIARIVTPFEGIGRGDGHVSPYQMPIRFFATIPDIQLP